MAAAATAEAESCGVPLADGSDGRGARASYAHAAAATSPSVANRGTDLTSDTGRLTAAGTENMAPIRRVSKQGSEPAVYRRTSALCQGRQRVTSLRKSSRTRDRARH